VLIQQAKEATVEGLVWTQDELAVFVRFDSERQVPQLRIDALFVPKGRRTDPIGPQQVQRIHVKGDAVADRYERHILRKYDTEKYRSAQSWTRVSLKKRPI
jgi:hypothetical protein